MFFKSPPAPLFQRGESIEAYYKGVVLRGLFQRGAQIKLLKGVENLRSNLIGGVEARHYRKAEAGRGKKLLTELRDLQRAGVEARPYISRKPVYPT
jgi:hypothetical protein